MAASYFALHLYICVTTSHFALYMQTWEPVLMCCHALHCVDMNCCLSVQRALMGHSQCGRATDTRQDVVIF